MSDRPIIFSGAMVRALLDGRKTQTRRLALQWRKTAPDNTSHDRYSIDSPWCRVQPGDRLWVRENFYLDDDGDYEFPVYATDNDAVKALIAHPESRAHHKKLRPSIHMPRWASRLTLTVTDVRRQRLQDIRADDCLAEGIPPITDEARWSKPLPKEPNLPAIYRGAFCQLWTDIHGAGAWDANPEIVALTFTVKRENIDAQDAARARAV